MTTTRTRKVGASLALAATALTFAACSGSTHLATGPAPRGTVTVTPTPVHTDAPIPMVPVTLAELAAIRPAESAYDGRMAALDPIRDPAADLNTVVHAFTRAGLLDDDLLDLKAAVDKAATRAGILAAQVAPFDRLTTDAVRQVRFWSDRAGVQGFKITDPTPSGHARRAFADDVIRIDVAIVKLAAEAHR